MTSSILCHNIMKDGVVISGGDTDFPFVNAINGSTSQQAKFSQNIDVIVVDLITPHEFDTLAISKHNIHSATGGSGFVRVFTGPSASGPFNEVVTLTPIDDKVDLLTLPTFHTSQFLRIEIGSDTPRTTDIFIGNISLGRKVAISNGQYTGFISPEYASKYTMTANVTRGGEIAGIIRTPKPITTKIRGRFIRDSWLMAHWDHINDCISRFPFYFEWDENKRAIYCWAKKIGSPTWTSGVHLEFFIDVEGFA